MIDKLSWDPYSARSWAHLLGMVHEPLFGASTNVAGDQHSVLIDGRRASFELSISSDLGLEGGDPLSWSWSANVRHAVIVNQLRDRMVVRRWDSPSKLSQFKVPTRTGAQALLQQLQDAAPPRGLGVIEWTLRVFRHLRQSNLDPSASLTVLNVLLLAMRQKAMGLLSDSGIRAARTLDDMATLLPEKMRALAVSKVDAKVRVDHLSAYMLDSRADIGLEFRADLLFRHAASQLYQEAHLILERDPQTFIPGLEPEPTFTRGPKEVRYTPTNLARALVQQAFEAIGAAAPQNGRLTIMDPACGSGVFLMESLREWQSGLHRSNLNLVGRDTSPMAEQVTNACLQLARSELDDDSSVAIDVRCLDSLRSEWPHADLILMNPPFCSWPDMTDADQSAVREILGELRAGRADKSLAFLWKAVAALRPNGILAAILPGALLDNQSGTAVREAIESKAEILMLGRFEGFSYFESSTVETAFVVLRKRSGQTKPAIKVLISTKGSEDASLRVLRGGEVLPADLNRIELFNVRPGIFKTGTWMPRRAAEIRLLEELAALKLPTIQQPFHVQQGIRTGNKKAFLLSDHELGQLPKPERRYFRKAAGQGTIDRGRLVPSELVFYPYDPKGLLFENLEEARKALPTYFEHWLEPNKAGLSGRKWADQWWLPERPRPWQFEWREKIVSTYFGKAGCFAFDREGDYVVLEGFGWQWLADDTSNSTAPSFAATDSPFAYLALLNSRFFERVVACYSWRLKGGQLRLERRFLDEVPLPDLAFDDQLSSALLNDLADLGQRIDRGELEAVLPDLDRAVCEAYRLPTSLLRELG